MQGGKSSSAVEAAKEAAANVSASAWAGKEKTKAVVQETVEKVKAARDPAAKASAEARKQDRIQQVEAVKRDAMRHNAAVKERVTAASYHPTTGTTGHGDVATDRSSDAKEADGVAGAVEKKGTRPVAVATEAVPADAATHDVPRAGSDDGDLPVSGTGRGVGKSDDYMPARHTAGSHSA